MGPIDGIRYTALTRAHIARLCRYPCSSDTGGPTRYVVDVGVSETCFAALDPSNIAHLHCCETEACGALPQYRFKSLKEAEVGVIGCSHTHALVRELLVRTLGNLGFAKMKVV